MLKIKYAHDHHESAKITQLVQKPSGLIKDVNKK
jgi:hypothetical protein